MKAIRVLVYEGQDSWVINTLEHSYIKPNGEWGPNQANVRDVSITSHTFTDLGEPLNIKSIKADARYSDPEKKYSLDDLIDMVKKMVDDDLRKRNNWEFVSNASELDENFRTGARKTMESIDNRISIYYMIIGYLKDLE